MKILFAENGIPKSLQCDNGTQLTSGEFQQLQANAVLNCNVISPFPHMGSLNTKQLRRRTQSANKLKKT